MNRTLILAMAMSILLAGASAASAGSMYRWVDDQGNVHYGQNPPTDVESEEIRAHSPAPGGQERRPEQPTMDDDDEEAPGADAGEDQAATEDADADPGEEYCDQHRQNLEALEHRTMVRETDPETGEERVLDEDEREARIQETREALEACD